MKPKTLNVYLGWDPRETVPYQVAHDSIARRTKEPVQIIPLKLGHIDFLKRLIEHKDGKLWCPISQAPMSTEFAISRFAVPFIQQNGWTLFADCDIICWSDIKEVFNLVDDKYAVMVVKHPHSNENTAKVVKMDGQTQTFYVRKNWSSVVLWNCDHEANKRFTIENLNTWPGRDLHAFKWLEDAEIGELSQEWNWLINVTSGEPEKKGIWHYTLGGPWFEGWRPAPFDSEWLSEAKKA